jgi:hypothetical protein
MEPVAELGRVRDDTPVTQDESSTLDPSATVRP